MTLGTDLTFLVAILAGLISFLSPCVLPLVPAYLGQLSAVAAAGSPVGSRPSRWLALRHAVAYVLGFGLVFTILGVTATYAGGALGQWLPLLRQIGGAILIVMGLNLAGILTVGRLQRTWRPLDLGASTVVAGATGGMVLQDPTRSRPGLADRLGGRMVGSGRGLVASFGLGTIFAIGWTPCIGTILGGILTMAATSGSTVQGGLLLTGYTLGLGCPVPGHRRPVRPRAGHPAAAPAPCPRDGHRRRAAGRRDRPGDALRPAVADAALLPVPDRGLMTTERPGFEHKPERHGLIGPFSGRQLAAVLGIVIVAAVVLVAATRPLGQVGATGPGDPRPTAYLLGSPTVGLEPGSLAPEMSGTRADGSAWALQDVNGHPISLAALRGKGIWINFWASWCPPCQSETPTLRDTYDAYKDRGLGDDRHQRPGDQPGRCRRLCREVRRRLHHRRGPVGRRPPPVPGVQPADPGVHRARRADPQGPDRTAVARAGRRRGRGDPAAASTRRLRDAGRDRAPGHGLPAP